MNALSTAITSTLTGDVTLVALLADSLSVYHQIAKNNATFPYIIFNKQSDTEPNDSSHRIVDLIYQIRAYTKTTTKAADAIDARVQELLHNQAIVITGYARLKFKRIGGIEFVEAEPNTEKVYSVGSLFRVTLEKTS
jgi:uncharacterized protein DUF3168